MVPLVFSDLFIEVEKMVNQAFIVFVCKSKKCGRELDCQKNHEDEEVVNHIREKGKRVLEDWSAPIV